MNRKDLQGEIERGLITTVQNSPCIRCGGDPYTMHYHARAMAYYLYELVKAYKFNETVDFEKAKERADKRTVKFFSDLSTRELEELLATAPGERELPEDPASEHPAPSLEPDETPVEPGAVASGTPSESPEDSPECPEEKTPPPQTDSSKPPTPDHQAQPE